MYKGLVMQDQRSDLFRLRDLDWFDRCENLKFSAVCPPKCKMKVSDSVNEMPRTWRQFGRPLACFYLYLDLCAFFSLCTSSNLIIFRLETVPVLLFNIKLFFYRPMEDSHKRSHVETGNMPHKPAEKKSREIECSHEESPVRRSLGFQQSLSPAQKVTLFMNVCNMCISQTT